MQRHGILIIDMLNDFVGENATLRCPGGEKIIPNLQIIYLGKRKKCKRT